MQFNIITPHLISSGSVLANDFSTLSSQFQWVAPVAFSTRISFRSESSFKLAWLFYAKRLTDELQLLQADLPALSPNLKDDEVTLTGILVQVILDLQIIITSLYGELQELESSKN